MQWKDAVWMLAHAALEWASLGENVHPSLGPRQSVAVTPSGHRLIATASRSSWNVQHVRQMVAFRPCERTKLAVSSKFPAPVVIGPSRLAYHIRGCRPSPPSPHIETLLRNGVGSSNARKALLVNSWSCPVSKTPRTFRGRPPVTGQTSTNWNESA